jgi:hypothetical protein
MIKHFKLKDKYFRLISKEKEFGVKGKGRPSLILLSSIMTLSILFILVTPVFALGSQSWNLDSHADGDLLPFDLCQMEQTFTPGDNGQSEHIHLASNASQIWIADQQAQSDIRYIGGDGAWILELVTDIDWQAEIIPSNCVVEIGEWNGTDFDAFDSMVPDNPDVEGIINNPNQLIITYVWQGLNETIHENCYLAIKVTNTDSQEHIIYCGEDEKSSCLTSTGTDPGYPNPPPSVPVSSWTGTIILTGCFGALLPLVLSRTRRSAG